MNHFPSSCSTEELVIDSAVAKELLVADRYYDNLCRIVGWRLAAVSKNARFCRESLDKGCSLQGHTGRWFFDLWVYATNCLPWFLPATIFMLPALFWGLVTFISGLLSYVTMEPRIVEATVTIPFLFFFETTKTVTETVMVPVVSAPDIRVAAAIASLTVATAIAVFSFTMKAIFKMEMRFRRRLLLRHIARSLPTPVQQLPPRF